MKWVALRAILSFAVELDLSFARGVSTAVALAECGLCLAQARPTTTKP